MSALRDIRAALAKLPPKPTDVERYILVGESAAKSIEVAVAVGEPAAVYEQIDGVQVRPTLNFLGWAVYERRGGRSVQIA